MSVDMVYYMSVFMCMCVSPFLRQGLSPACGSLNRLAAWCLSRGDPPATAFPVLGYGTSHHAQLLDFSSGDETQELMVARQAP